MLAETVIKGLKSRNMSGYYAENREEALKIALELIPESAEVKDTLKQIRDARTEAAKKADEKNKDKAEKK